MSVMSVEDTTEDEETMVDTLSQNPLLTHTPFIFTKATFSEPDNGTKDFKLESDRLESFKNSTSPILAEDLARVGLYFNDNKAKCAFCDLELSFNALSENLLDDHLRKCSFATSKKGQRTLSSFLSSLPADQDVCGNVDTFTDSVKFLSKLVHPYEDFETRKKSFATWPKTNKQEPEVLALSGFYYTGISDQTVCFHCSGPLNNWEDEDDPWEQHALWYPKCGYIIKEKGEDFVKEVHKKLKIFGSTQNEKKVCLDVDEENMCVICCNNQREVVFVPCGHDWTCLKCLRSLEDTKCPICREQIVRVKNL